MMGNVYKIIYITNKKHINKLIKQAYSYIHKYTYHSCQVRGRLTMSIKRTVTAQYQAIVDEAAEAVHALRVPREGWIRTVRKALGMSGAQLGRRMDITRAQIAQTERNELSGGVTLRSMQRAAEGLGCRFVYAIVPPDGSVAAVIEARAREKAATIVARANEHMALEAQTLSGTQIDFEIDRLTQAFMRDLPGELWNDK